MSSELAPPAVAGIQPGEVVSPADLAELSTALRQTADAGQSVVVAGAMTKIEQGAAPRSLDVLLSTTGLSQVVEHAAGDLVVTAQAGLRLAALQEHLASSRQWLALDPPEADATVGGVVAAAASGPRRLLYGTPRDLLIGITVVLADGTVARSGGKVVKNVAGYDLGKLFTGSFGTLGVIAECTFRLHPVQPACRVVTAAVDDPVDAARRLRATGAVPCALEYDGEVLTAVVESVEPAAEAQAADIAVAIGGDTTDRLPEEFGRRPDTAVLLKATHRLGALSEAVAALRSLLPGSKLRAHVGSGVVWVGADDLASLGALRERFAALAGSVVVVRAPQGLRAGVDPWGPATGIDVMRRIKAQFDPDGRMSPGRFVGGI